jgi:sugar phosphate isomerase/epimerase
MAIEIGLCAAVYGDVGLSEAAAAIADEGIKVIDLPTDSILALLGPCGDLENSSYRKSVADELDSYGLTARTVSNSRDTQLILGPHGPETDAICADDSEAKRAHGLRYAYATMNLARDLGSEQARLFLGAPSYSHWLNWPGADDLWERSMSQWIESIQPLLCYARECGIRLAIEPHPKQMIYNRHSAEIALERLASFIDVFTLCIDPANVAALGYDPVSMVAGWGPVVGAVHAKDLEIWRGSEWPTQPGWRTYGPQPPIRFRTLGLGELPWKRIVTALLEDRYDGVIYIEHEDVLIPRGKGIHRAQQVLREAIPDETPEGRTR